MRGNPGNMQNNTVYQNLGCEIYDFFINKIKILIQNGISEIILDPGFGFGKSLEDNYKLLASMHFFNSIHYISLLGLSRKSMIYKTLNLNPSDVLNGTTALHGISFHQNPQILRVHDVKEAKEAIKIWNIYKKMT
jgi:dihydropteroate synthase